MKGDLVYNSCLLSGSMILLIIQGGIISVAITGPA
jgi:hypothetical protein